MRKIIFLLSTSVLVNIYSNITKAQQIDTVSTWSLSAYVDAYYAYYTDSVGIGKYQKFPTVSPRSNSIGINVFQIAAQYDGEKVRAMAVLHFGDIPNSSWSATYNAIEEAHAGIKIFKTLWLDAGFFRSHFGTEFLLPKENLTSSLAVTTYFEPFYESGFRLNFDPTKRLEINLFGLNGYGLFEDNNNNKSIGMGITYVLNDNIGIGYTNYIGDDTPRDTLPHLRFSNNLFINCQFKKVKIQVGADYCFQQNSDLATMSKTATMYSGLATVKYQAKPKFAIYARGEIFNDPNSIMAASFKDQSGNKTGYKLWGLTAGLEFKPSDNSYIRIEGRRLQMDQAQDIFRYNGQNLNYRNEIMVNMGLSFDLLKGVQTKKGNTSNVIITPNNN